MNKKVIIALGVLVILGGAIWAVMAMRPQASTDNNTGSDQPAHNNQSNASSNASTASGTEIIYTDQGFSPETLTVKAGTTVKIINKSSSPLEFSSDDHPTHTKHPEYNMDTIAAGGEGSLEVKTIGTWGYHNHLKARDTGKIVVE